jgi:hypothetical protein
MNGSNSYSMQRLATALRNLLRPRQPLLLTALLHQVPRLRSVHQVHQLRSLAASWLAAPDLAAVDRALHLRLQQMVLETMASPRSTSSSAKTARSITKRRR